MKKRAVLTDAHSFYMSVYSYITMEYKPSYSKILADSDISEMLVDFITRYYWGGNTVQFTAGQTIDLIKIKYNI
jgi:hypothetical protein